MDMQVQDLMKQQAEALSQLDSMTGYAGDQRKAVDLIKEELDAMEAHYVLDNGGWKALGSNDTERKYKVQVALANMPAYAGVLAQKHEAVAELANYNQTIETLHKTLYALASIMRLYGAWLVSTGAVTMEVPGGSNGNGQPEFAGDLDL